MYVQSSLPYIFINLHAALRTQLSFPTRRSSDLHLASEVPLEAGARRALPDLGGGAAARRGRPRLPPPRPGRCDRIRRSEEHTSELQSRGHLVCRLMLEKKQQRYI